MTKLMNNADVVYQRLQNQRLASAKLKKDVDVVRWFGAMQAQDFHGAKWAIAQRMSTTTNAAIEKAFNGGTIVRTHLMRPTWHFVAPEDIRWLLKLTAPRVNLACGTNYRKLELDTTIFNRSNKALTRALAGGKHLTRVTLKKVLNEAGVAADDGVRLAHILLRAELDGVVCSGPRMGNQFTYALLDERVPTTNSLTHEEALSKLTERYFRSHGPATVQDFVWWSGLTTADAKKGLALVQGEIVNGKTYWTSSAARAKRSSDSVYLLPAYDEYLVAYKDRTAAVGNADSIFGPTIIIDGIVAGRWNRALTNSSAVITMEPSRVLNRNEKLNLKEAAERYAAFLGLRAEIRTAK
jgi:DNA glycosylase AlkZ-like